MNHKLSITTYAAERYLLGELPPDEREAFEEHYFQCSECAEQVRFAVEFRAGAKAVFPEMPARVPARNRERRSWFDWMGRAVLAPMAACLALATITVYQNSVIIPALRSRVAESSRAQVLSSVVLVPSTRGSLPSIHIPAGANFFQISLEVSPALRSEKYECDLRSSSGKSILKVPVSKSAMDTSLNLLIPAAAFTAGSYEAVLLGVTGQQTKELDRYQFGIRR